VIDTRAALGEVYEKSTRLPQAHATWQECLTVLQSVADAHSSDAKLAAKIAELERRICNRYGALGIWPLAAVHAQRNARLHRSAEPLWDSPFAILLPVMGEEETLRACRSCFDQAAAGLVADSGRSMT
jgi:hypothetical protein